MSLVPPALLSVVDPRPLVHAAARQAFGDAPGRPILDGGRTVGVRHESADASYCFLEEIVPPDLRAAGEAQTTAIFETIERVLRAEGMAFSHLVRTWFYLDRILDWYDGFNRARTPFLQARGAFDGLLPASTGIGMPNRHGAAVIAGALAIERKGAGVCEVASPLQCSALDYRSAFSRAVEVARKGRRELYISGTASIEPGGKTAHVDDAPAQIGLTMEVAEAILRSRGMDWSHCSRAVAYLKRPEYATHFARHLAAHGLEALPVTWMHADVCRDDLLFEIELDATLRTE
ncbi:MAG: hypothetical protein PHQ12_08955 [Chthoniobacteraceae bacterium]|nr:hypothetical protein [Chthoniobacteraceae bacterium]